MDVVTEASLQQRVVKLPQSLYARIGDRASKGMIMSLGEPTRVRLHQGPVKQRHVTDPASDHLTILRRVLEASAVARHQVTEAASSATGP